MFVTQPLALRNVTIQIMFKIDKGPYGLKEAPRTWYAILSTYLLYHGYLRGKVPSKLGFVRIFMEKEEAFYQSLHL